MSEALKRLDMVKVGTVDDTQGGQCVTGGLASTPTEKALSTSLIPELSHQAMTGCGGLN